MAAGDGVGPDIVIAGSARSGTTFLASVLSGHPDVDACAVKEPNYFSREIERGPEWYDGLYRPRRAGLKRLDASMSYTFAHFPDAVDRLADTAPDAYVVYGVRHPVARLLSHFQLHRDYFQNDSAHTLGDTLVRPTVYSGASDYASWLPLLEKRFGPDRLLVVPFPVLTDRLGEVLDAVCAGSGLDRAPFDSVDAAGDQAQRHRNQVVELRGRGVLVGRRLVRRAGFYPAVRRALGPDRLRRVRAWTTRPVEREDLAEALATCTSEQHAQLGDLYTSAVEAVAGHLERQDVHLGLSWSADWRRECPRPGAQGVDW